MFVPNRRILDKRFVSQVVTEPVKEFALSRGLQYGDSIFGSVACIDIRTQGNDILHLSIKSVLPMTGIIDKNTLSKAKLSVALKLFPVEICYYEQIRPGILEALKTFGDKLEERNTIFITPKYFSSHTDQVGLHDYLALEDLKPCGYKASNRFNGLTFNEVTATLREIALLHAVSYVLLETKNQGIISLQQNPECLLNTHFWERLATYDTTMKELYDGIVSSTVNTMKEKGAKLPNGLESFASRGHATIINLWKKTSTCPKYFRVLVHGNAWTNNILFNKVEFGKALDVKLINFQQARFGNIYEDLLYFFFTSTTEEFRCNHLNTCLTTYFHEFVQIVERLNFPLPEGFTEQNLIATFYENISYGFLYNLVEVPFQLGMQPPPPSPMTPVESSDEMRKFFSNMSFDSGNNLPSATCKTNVDEREEKITIKSVVSKLIDTLNVGIEHSPVAQKRLNEMFHEMGERGIL